MRTRRRIPGIMSGIRIKKSRGTSEMRITVRSFTRRTLQYKLCLRASPRAGSQGRSWRRRIFTGRDLYRDGTRISGNGTRYRCVWDHTHRRHLYGTRDCRNDRRKWELLLTEESGGSRNISVSWGDRGYCSFQELSSAVGKSKEFVKKM